MVHENQRAALKAQSDRRANAPRCINGHELPMERNAQGRRKCKRCHAVYSRRWRNRRRKLVRELLILLSAYRAGQISAQGFAGRAAMLQMEHEGVELPGAVERPTPLDMERESFQREAIERYAGPD